MKQQDKKAEMEFSAANLKRGFEQPEDWGCQPEEIRKQLQFLSIVLEGNLLILDAGCGVGTYSIALSEKGSDVIGLDISFEELKVAQRRAKQGNSKFSPFVGDLERLPFKDNSFDICFCGATLHHFPDIYLAVNELTRVLKPGRKLAVIEPNGSNPIESFSGNLKRLISPLLVKSGFDTPNERVHKCGDYTRALANTGFKDIQLSSFYLGKSPVFPYKLRNGKVKLSSLAFSLILYPLIWLRHLGYVVSSKILSSSIGGASLAITATKEGQL